MKFVWIYFYQNENKILVRIYIVVCESARFYGGDETIWIKFYTMLYVKK
jgi:hypothetical protein